MIRSQRFTTLAVLALVSAILSLQPDPAAAQSGRFSGVTLRVGTFGGSWKDAVHEAAGRQFEAQGGKVLYVIGNPAENLSKVLAARGGEVPIDLMELGPAERVGMIKNDLLADMPTAGMTNLAKIPPGFVDKKTIAHVIIENGIVYRTDIFESEKLPVPKGYGDLAIAKLSKRTAFPDVTNTQHWTAVSALAMEAGGSESAPAQGFAKVVQSNPLYFFSAATELAQKFSAGEVVAAPWHAGWAIRLERAGQKVGFVHPQVGNKRGAMEYNYFGIVRGSKNADAAAAFVNLFLDTDEQAKFGRAVGAVPANRDARAILQKDPAISKFLLLSDREIADAYTVDWNAVDQQKWRSEWLRAIGK